LSIKGIAIWPDKTVREVTIDGLEDMQKIVKGLIEPIDLSDNVTMYVNEEGRYQFGFAQVNWMAADVCGLGRRPEFMFGRPPLLGPVLLVGHDRARGRDVDLPDEGRRWVQRVGREAGAKWVDQDA
jgi:hypothetical protein